MARDRCSLETLDDALCPGAPCPFWEPGGAVLGGRCTFEGVELSRYPEVARELARLRDELESLHEDALREQLTHLYHRLLNTSGD